MEEIDDNLKRLSEIDDHPNQQSTQSTAVNNQVNNLEGAARDCNFFNPTIKDEASAIADRIRDMIAMYSPDEYIRKSALRHEALTLEQLIDITTNYEIMSRASTLIKQNENQDTSDEIMYSNNTQKDNIADTTPQTCNDQDEIYISIANKNNSVVV
ncbi:hypothetical protein GJ496_007201 [Pomphorhynchus laevis]|nr:hypothetical protein GJ496_007201 [Pomphorhynchus laevis]